MKIKSIFLKLLLLNSFAASCDHVNPDIPLHVGINVVESELVVDKMIFMKGNYSLNNLCNILGNQLLREIAKIFNHFCQTPVEFVLYQKKGAGIDHHFPVDLFNVLDFKGL